MFSSDQYELIDFGDSRKLERFGDYLIDRPCPAAEFQPQSDPKAWANASGRFDRRAGLQGDWCWKTASSLERWSIHCRLGIAEEMQVADASKIQFDLRPTPAGQLGIFPEQAENWNWISDWVAQRVADSTQTKRPKILNLFAYTGGSTLAGARSGAEVVHVDAARNVVQWARQNAEASSLKDAPIRWIVEDVPKFVSRELKRGNQYDGIVLDPPTYGHGPKRQEWAIERDLPQLIQQSLALIPNPNSFLLLTCHSAEFDVTRLGSAFRSIVPSDRTGDMQLGEMGLRTARGNVLPSGVVLRWTGVS